MPQDGLVIATTRAQVSVRYSEPVEMQFGAVRVFSLSEAWVDDGASRPPFGHGDTGGVGLKPGLVRDT